jgi:hypothetical protein
LDQDDQRQCQKNQDRKKSRRQRQIVNLGIIHEIDGLVRAGTALGGRYNVTPSQHGGKVGDRATTL